MRLISTTAGNHSITKLALCVCALVLFQSCNATTHNEIFGVEEATVNGHTIEVTDCYRWGKQQLQTIEDAPGKSIHRFNPCRDADILIKYEELIVNGKSYGMLNKGDRITLDHHKLFINGKETREIASR